MNQLTTPEDMVLMLNMGWNLPEIANQTGIPVKVVELLIVAQAHKERIIAKLISVSV